MKPNVKKILEHLSTHKIELVRKAPSILNDLKKLDDRLRKQEDKMNKVSQSYRKAWDDSSKIVKDMQVDLKTLDKDIEDVNKAIKELGINENDVDGLKESKTLSEKMDDYLKSFLKLWKPS